jgi:GNAT superfamily N-acetyltransferase
VSSKAFAMALVIYWPVMFEEVIRQPRFEEHNSVRAVVQTVVDEIYGGLWAPPPLPIDDDCWLMSWVAVVDTKIVGVALTHEQWLSDLWVLRDSRGHGIGQRLLARAEAEMVGRGYQTLRLRVLQWNARAVNFYHREGWRTARQFPHEKFPVTMLEMVKSFPQGEK